MTRDQHINFTEEELALPPGKWVIGRDRVLHYQPEPNPQTWIPHNTDAGYYRHLYYNIPPCDECKDAHAEIAAKRTGGTKQQKAQCGTTSGYKRHLLTLGEKPCPQCTQANREYNRNNRTQRLQKAQLYGVPVAGQTQCAGCKTIIDRRSTRCQPCYQNERKANAKTGHKHSHEVDEMVVNRMLGGEWNMKTTRAEKVAVCEAWASRGASMNELSRLTGWRIERYYRASDNTQKAA